MALEMMLEIERGIQPDNIRAILLASGVEGDEFPVSFPISQMQFYCDFADEAADFCSRVICEEVQDIAHWDVGGRILFRYRSNEYDLCTQQIRDFVVKLAASSKASFVLSFQYETMYAMRDPAGLRFASHFVPGI